jgi:hypothetical protein
MVYIIVIAPVPIEVSDLSFRDVSPVINFCGRNFSARNPCSYSDGLYTAYLCHLLDGECL